MLSLPILTYGQDSDILRKANAGDAEAQYAMYLCFDKDIEVGQSLSEEGLSWLMKAAENGYPEAQWWIARNYFYGWHGFPKDSERYLHWLAKLAGNDSNYADRESKGYIGSAQFDMAEIYHRGKFGFQMDIPECLKWYKMAVNNGHFSAAFELGHYYQYKDDQEAIRWYKKAMDLYWEKWNKEYELAAKRLRELGVDYHPGV